MNFEINKELLEHLTKLLGREKAVEELVNTFRVCVNELADELESSKQDTK